MKKKLFCLSFMIAFIASFFVCSDAPEIQFPEPTDRMVLAELFTEDF